MADGGELGATLGPRRVQILVALWGRDLAVGELREALGGNLSYGAVSQHLRKLRDLGLVEVTPAGARRHYRVRTGALGSAKGWLAGLARERGAAAALGAAAERSRRGPRRR